MDAVSALEAAVDEFGRRLAAVAPDQWSSPTPCDEWDVQYLVAHVVGGNRFACAVLAGSSFGDAIAEVMSSPQLGTDPVAAWSSTAAAQAAAFHQPGALDALVDHPVGQITGGDLLGFRTFDITLHAWDLARAIGADATLPGELVAHVLGIVESGPPGMGFGIVPAQSAADPEPQARLLALTGRVDTGTGSSLPAPGDG